MRQVRRDGIRWAQRARTARDRLAGIALATASLLVAGCPADSTGERDGIPVDTSGIVGSLPDTGPEPAAPVEVSSRPWDEARARGVDFRAIGQEPGWSLELDRGRAFHYVGDYGRTQVTLPAPEPVRDSAGVVVYHVQTDEHDLMVVIEQVPCQDVMSGEEFTHSVTLRLDDHELEGCGRELTFDAAPPA